MTALIIFTSYSIVMAVVWLLLRSPDLAITEAAVGAGVDGVLFFQIQDSVNAAYQVRDLHAAILNLIMTNIRIM